MLKIPIDQARAGQILVRPVPNASGAILVQSGTVLSSTLIERLGNAGVTHLHVPCGEPSAARPIEEQVAEARARFAGHEQDPLMMELLDVVVTQIEHSADASGPR